MALIYIKKRSRRPLVRSAAKAARQGAPYKRLPLRYMRGWNLSEIDLRGLPMAGANLRDADLRGSNIAMTDLRDADLRGADLRHALGFYQAKLDGAKLDGAKLPIDWPGTQV